MLFINRINAQPIPPNHGQGQNQIPSGGAPIDGSLLFLVVFAVIYICAKSYLNYLKTKVKN